MGILGWALLNFDMGVRCSVIPILLNLKPPPKHSAKNKTDVNKPWMAL